MSELAVQQPTQRELVMLRLNGEIDLGKPLAKIPKGKLPIPVLEWLAATNDRSANTEDAYHRAVSAWLTWCLAGQPVIDPHRARLADAEAWNRYMKNKGLSDRTRNQRISACSALYRRLLAE